MWLKTSQRILVPELMDEVELHPDVLEAVYQDIEKVNTHLNREDVVWTILEDWMNKSDRKEFTVADLGCGDGSMLRRLALKCREKSFKVQFTGMDNNSGSLTLANRFTSSFPEISYQHQDLKQLALAKNTFDIIYCNFTLHHFSNHEVKQLLQSMGNKVHMGIVITDLERSTLARGLFRLYSMVFLKTQIAQHDGLASIRNGFLKKELSQFSRLLPDFEHQIARKWAFRFLWTMKRKTGIR